MKTITLTPAKPKVRKAVQSRPKPTVTMTGIEVGLPSGHKETLTIKELHYLEDAIQNVLNLY